MKHTYALLILGFVVAVGGCKKKDGELAAAGSGSASAPAPAVATAPPPATAVPTGGACPSGQTLLDGPQICIALPDGYVKPLKLDGAKDPTGGHVQVSYSKDGSSGGAFVASVQITYNAAPPSPINWEDFTKDAAEYCDAPPTMRDVGKGKYFTCPSKKLGNTYSKSKIPTAKNLIECDTQSDAKPDVDALCKTLTQL